MATGSRRVRSPRRFERASSSLVVACAMGVYGYFAWTGRNVVGAVAVGVVFAGVFWFGVLGRLDLSGAERGRKESGRAAFAAKNLYALALCVIAVVLVGVAVAESAWGLLIPAALLAAVGAGLLALRRQVSS